MRVLPLWQPWASLIACGAKRVETRSWEAQSLVGERIAIHAAKTTQELDLCATEPFSRYVPERDRLPLGAIVCTAVLDRIKPITAETAAELEERLPEEFAFGDYTPGRFAWVLRDAELITPPVAHRGKQGIGYVHDNHLSGGVPITYPDQDVPADEEPWDGATCSSCGAPILWTISPKHQRMPVDPEPVANGNLTLAAHFDGTVVYSRVEPSEGTHVSHFSTCPDAAEHRRRDQSPDKEAARA